MKWIKISEKLPEPNTYFLWTDGKKIFQGTLCYSKDDEKNIVMSLSIDCNSTWDEVGNLTYWMPLPNLPMEIK